MGHIKALILSRKFFSGVAGEPDMNETIEELNIATF